ncbi:ABC transporter permease subunit [Streptomyces sp. A73]|nr:ABC transporter permease subunit [Streptomyces sp. A73]
MSTVPTSRSRPDTTARTPVPASPAPPAAAPPPGQFKALAKGMTKELVRDPMALFFSVVFPVLLAGLFVAIMQLTWAGGPYKIAVVGSGTQAAQLRDALGDGSKVAAVDSPRDAREDTDAVIAPSADGDSLRLVTDPESPSVVSAVRDVLPQTGWEGRHLDAVGTDGSPPFEPMPFVLPGVLVFALMSLALSATAGTLVSLRANGTLRLLRTTPARPQAILTSLLPARGALGLALLAVAGAIATVLGLLTPLSGLTMLLTTVLGLWLLVLALTPGKRSLLTMRPDVPQVRAGLERSAAALVLRDRAMQIPGVQSVRVKVARRKIRARAMAHFRDLDEVRGELDGALREGIGQLGLARRPGLSVHVRRPAKRR